MENRTTPAAFSSTVSAPEPIAPSSKLIYSEQRPEAQMDQPAAFSAASQTIRA